MENVVKEYKKQKRKLFIIRFVAILLVAVLVSTMIWSYWFIVPFVVLAIIEFALEYKIKNKKDEILKEYETEIKRMPIKRLKINRVVIMKNGEVQMETEMGSVVHKKVAIIKSRIKEPVYEERVVSEEIKREKDLLKLFPKPTLFIPYKEDGKTFYE